MWPSSSLYYWKTKGFRRMKLIVIDTLRNSFDWLLEYHVHLQNEFRIKTVSCPTDKLPHKQSEAFQETVSFANKSSRSQMFFKIGVLKNLANFTGKHLCLSIFLIKLKAWRPTLLKTGSNTGVFPRFFWSF